MMPVAAAHVPGSEPCIHAVQGSALLYASVGDDQPAPRSTRKKSTTKNFVYHI